jgi:hypothetical protein
MMMFNESGRLVGIVHETESGFHAHVPGGRGEPTDAVATGSRDTFPYPHGVSHQRFANALARCSGGAMLVPVDRIDSVLDALRRRRAEMVRVAAIGGAR